MNKIKTVLLIEDSNDDAILTKRAMEKLAFPFQFVTAKNGDDAFNYLYGNKSSHNYEPKLILLDLNLPKVSGLEILQRIKSDPASKTIPVVVLTSSREDKDIRQCLELGANSYIQKPVDFVKFAEVANIIGTYWLTLNETV